MRGAGGFLRLELGGSLDPGFTVWCIAGAGNSASFRLLSVDHYICLVLHFSRQIFAWSGSGCLFWHGGPSSGAMKFCIVRSLQFIDPVTKQKIRFVDKGAKEAAEMEAL
jgi:hypothetical protein